MGTKLWQLQKNMNNKDYRPKGLPAVLAGISVALNIVTWGIVLATFPKNSPTAILHYTAGIGVDFIGSGLQIITLPAIGTLIIVVNTLLAKFIASINTAAFWVLWGSVPLIQCILLATYGILLTLNR